MNFLYVNGTECFPQRVIVYGKTFIILIFKNLEFNNIWMMKLRAAQVLFVHQRFYRKTLRRHTHQKDHYYFTNVS